MADTYDVSAFRIVAGAPAIHVMADALTSGETLQYEAKLAQRVAIELLTAKKSMPFAQDRGTNLIPRLRSGRVRTEHDLFVTFSVAALDLAKNLKSEDDASQEPRSCFRRARLLRLALSRSGGSAELAIEVMSRAGTKANLILPINVKL